METPMNPSRPQVRMEELINFLNKHLQPIDPETGELNMKAFMVWIKWKDQTPEGIKAFRKRYGTLKRRAYDKWQQSLPYLPSKTRPKYTETDLSQALDKARSRNRENVEEQDGLAREEWEAIQDANPDQFKKEAEAEIKKGTLWV